MTINFDSLVEGKVEEVKDVNIQLKVLEAMGIDITDAEAAAESIKAMVAAVASKEEPKVEEEPKAEEPKVEEPAVEVFFFEDEIDAENLSEAIAAQRQQTIDTLKTVHIALGEKEAFVEYLKSNESFVAIAGEDVEQWESKVGEVLAKLEEAEAEPSTEAMALTDFLMWGFMNRLFTSWTKNLTKMKASLEKQLANYKEIMNEDEKIEALLMKQKSRWLPAYGTTVAIQKDIISLFKACEVAVANIGKEDDASIKKVAEEMKSISQNLGIKSTKWGGVIGAYLGGAVGYGFGAVIGGLIGSLAGPIGTMIGAGVGTVAGGFAGGAVGAKLPVSQLGKIGYDANKLMAVGQEQIKVIDAVIASMKKVEDLKGNVPEGVDKKKMKDRATVLKGAVKLGLRLTHVLNRGIAEAI